MTPSSILTTLYARGARIDLVDADHLAVTPRSVLDDEIRAAIRRCKPALVRLLAAAAPDYEAIYAELTAGARTAEDLLAIGRHADLNADWVTDEIVWLDIRCDRLAHAGADEATFKAGVTLLVARVDELRRWQEGTPPSLAARRLVLEHYAPVAVPVQLDDGTVIDNVGRFIARVFTAVEYVIARRSEAADTVLGVYLDQLRQCGIHAVVGVVQ